MIIKIICWVMLIWPSTILYIFHSYVISPSIWHNIIIPCLAGDCWCLSHLIQTWACLNTFHTSLVTCYMQKLTASITQPMAVYCRGTKTSIHGLTQHFPCSWKLLLVLSYITWTDLWYKQCIIQYSIIFSINWSHN